MCKLPTANNQHPDKKVFRFQPSPLYPPFAKGFGVAQQGSDRQAGFRFKNLNLRLLLIIVISICSLASYFLLLTSSVKADELDDIAKQIEELNKAKQMSEDATKPLEAEVSVIEGKLNNIQAGIQRAAKQIKDLEASITQREKDFDHQYALLSDRVERLYKQQRSPSEFLLLFSGSSLGALARDVSYRKAAATEDKNMIIQISADLSKLKTDKQKLEKDKQTLASLQAQLATQQAFFEKEIQGAKDYQKTLAKQITELSEKQKALLAKKTESFQISVGNVPLADDPASRPDYNPGFSPAFAAFSFGAPHFKGMSQYGALGRAKSGQSVEDILKAYYGNVRIESVDTNFDIQTTEGGKNFEGNYLKGIAEMPTSWADDGGFEALKAQAIAARSYALAYTDWRMGSRSVKKPICTTENCQVYNSGKAGNPGRWGDAVNDTKGKIIVSNNSNEVVNAWYASTSGGYQESYSALGHNTPGFWDTKNGRSGWTSEAYEKIAGSPWFYKAWFKTRGGTNCNRSHPWLNQEEMADIVNAVLVFTNDSGAQSHLSQEDSSCYGEAIPDTWSKSRLREEAGKYEGAVTGISSVSVTYNDSGVTSQVLFNTNRGAVSFDGQVFYKVFNLRAPGAVHLTSGLFNLEKK